VIDELGLSLLELVAGQKGVFHLALDVDQELVDSDHVKGALGHEVVINADAIFFGDGEVVFAFSSAGEFHGKKSSGGIPAE
jgi:hypothetical protein